MAQRIHHGRNRPRSIYRRLPEIIPASIKLRKHPAWFAVKWVDMPPTTRRIPPVGPTILLLQQAYKEGTESLLPAADSRSIRTPELFVIALFVKIKYLFVQIHMKKVY